jgi:hypothetical protein
MNTWDIEDAKLRFQDHPVLGPATQTLSNLEDWTDRNSDGWAYWPKPVRAADRLMTLIEGTDRWDTERLDATPQAYKAALQPLRAFKTRHGATTFEIVDL